MYFEKRVMRIKLDIDIVLVMIGMNILHWTRFYTTYCFDIYIHVVKSYCEQVTFKWNLI